MRKTKELRIIEDGEETYQELLQIYEDGIGATKFNNLLKEYKLVYKRQEKILKISDTTSTHIFKKNNSLNMSMKYIITSAQTKLIYNVKEHLKTKKTASKLRSQLKNFASILKDTLEENKKLEKKLHYYIKNYGEINHSFNEEIKDNNLKSLSLNSIKYKNMNIEQMLSLELSENKTNFILVKCSLDNFDLMIDTIIENSSINNFLQGTYRYLKNCFSKKDIIYHSNMETFYIIIRNKDLSIVKKIMANINNKRSVYNHNIVFTFGIAQFLEEDTNEMFLRRCEDSYLKAKTGG